MRAGSSWVSAASGERHREIGDPWQRAHLGHEPPHARGRPAGAGHSGVAEEFPLELFTSHRKVRPAARVILTLLEEAAITEPDGYMPDELSRIVDARIQLIAHLARNREHRP